MKITNENNKPRKSTANESNCIYSNIGSENLIGKNPNKVLIFVEYSIILFWITL